MDITSVSNPVPRLHRSSEQISAEHMAALINGIRAGRLKDGQPVEFYLCRLQSPKQQSPEKQDPDRQITGLLLLSGKVGASTAPMSCVVYRSRPDIASLLTQIGESEPELTAPTVNGCTLQLWPVYDSTHGQVLRQFAADEILYKLNNDALSQVSEARHGLPVLMLSADEVQTLPRHRLFADLAGMDDYEFLQRLQKCFNIRVALSADDACPAGEREFGLYLAGHWYRLRLIDGTWFAADPVSDLDISILQDNMMAPVLGIRDEADIRVGKPAENSTLDDLQATVDSGRWQAVFVLYPLELDRLMTLSNLGRQAPSGSVAFDTAGLREILMSVFESESGITTITTDIKATDTAAGARHR